MKPRFAILASPRSGSNMLCTMLDAHPSILCHHEIFNPKGIRLALRLRDTNFTLGNLEERERDPEAFLERVWTNSLGCVCVGFKLTHRQDELVLNRLLSDTTIAKIVLRRRNRLKTYVSLRMAETLAQWEVYREHDLIRDRPRVRVEPGRFLEWVAFDDEYHAEVREAVERNGHDWIDVSYERLFSIAEQGRIVRFLGVEPQPAGLQIGSIKQNSRDLRDLIENYDELLDYFAGTPFEADLADGGN